MSSTAYPLSRIRWFVPLMLGAWAAAIAVAPAWPMKLALLAPAVLIPVSLWTLERPSRWIVCFLAAALVLPPAPIAWGTTGPHPSLWFAALGVLGGMLWLSHWRVRIRGVSAAVLTLFIVLLASVPLAAWYSGPAIAAGSFVRVALLGIAVYVYFYTAQGPGRGQKVLPAMRALYWTAVVSALFACVDFYFQFPAPGGYGAQYLWLDTGVFRRAQGVFYDTGALGNFCAFFLVMIAAAIAGPREASPVSRKALAAGGVVFLAAMVLSYSRAATLNVLTALAVLGWVNRKRFRVWRLASILVLGGAAAAVLLNALVPEFFGAYWQRLSGSAQYLTTATEAVFSGRLASWRLLIDWVGAHPWQAWLGIGYKTLPYTHYLGSPIIGDNQYLSLLVETGVAGLAGLIWLCVAILRACGRAAWSADPAQAFAGTWMLCFWSGQMVQMLLGDALTYWRVLPLYFWVLALAVRE